MKNWSPILQGWFPLWDPRYNFPFVFKGKMDSTPDIRRAGIIPILAHSPGLEQDRQRDLWRKITRRGEPKGEVALISLFAANDGVDSDEYIQARMRDYEWCTPRHYVHSNPHAREGTYWNILFNRSKAFFTDRSPRLRRLHWTEHHTDAMWKLNDIPKWKESVKFTFIAPTRIYADALANRNPRMIYRERLVNLCRDLPTGHCTHGNPLEPQDATPAMRKLTEQHTSSIWAPIANHWYEQSFFSAYVETIVEGHGIGGITEKTYDPLIKGHFVLPFGYPGIVDDIWREGFKLPHFIDYSYDRIDNTEQRWVAYSRELRRLAELPLEQWQWHHADYVKDLEKNRNLFFKRRYDKLKFNRESKKEKPVDEYAHTE